ncbi:hypothetical protein [Nostoc sp.]|uniref:hypothetical protein n=1 Tax=Nostoc sp. TaxID=1180 RepID=UPI002FFB6602
MSSSVADGILRPGESITSRTITVYDPDALRVDFTPGIYAKPYKSQNPVITSDAIITAAVGQQYGYQIAAFDPNGAALSYLLYNAPKGMSVEQYLRQKNSMKREG